ncbi:MAG TPA: O-antigen ligase family protein [Chitinophagaceae bacterium]|nr:O-antigen ligase family protein [Chitinophagaceae bacterium]
MNRSKQLDLLLYLWFIIFFISMVCCFRAVSSISMGLIVVTGLLKNKMDTGSWLNTRVKNWFPAACCLFYLIQAVALLYTGNFTESAKNLQIKSAMLFVPFALCCSDYLNGRVYQKLMKYYIWILAAVLFYCLLLASYKYCFMNAQNTVFFYHQLVIPFRQHAVQVSIYLFIGLIYLLEKAKNGLGFHATAIHMLLIFYFICCLLLLSSKLVISFSACCLVYYFYLLLRAKFNYRLILFTSLFAGLAMIILVMSTQNRISKRFNEILSGNLSLVQQRNFTPAIYFNGLQFRLLQWRFVKEILTEDNAWLTGVSGDAQKLLDNKYISTHMYTGGVNTPDRGYLGYNTHDQFLQSLLESGIPGLLAFILICFAMMHLAIRRQRRELTITVMLLIAYCFNEAVFETQYGIMLFTFFPLFLYYCVENKPIPVTPLN